MTSEASSFLQDDLFDGDEFTVLLSFEMSSDASSPSYDDLVCGFLISLPPLFSFLSGDFLLRVPFTWHNEHLSL